MYWADELARKVIEKFPGKSKYICASGITPSGIIHIGHLREVLVGEFVTRALKDLGKDAQQIWSWDDYDRLRKIPKNVPADFEQYLGMPISDIPDPFGCHESYAKHFEAELEKSLPELGIEARIIRQSEMYKKNAYYLQVKEALQKRKEIAKVLYSYKAQGGSEEEIDKYYPLNIYCSDCNRDSTWITDYDGENLVSYECKCGFKEIADISKKNIGKLAWRVDWPLRWRYENVAFEPAGRDHISASGSVDVSGHLARDVFGFEPPLFQGYEWIGIQGGTHKMSSSTGEVFTAGMLLEIYEPEIIRWFYARVKPEIVFNFALNDQILKNYAEWDSLLKRNLEGILTDEEKRMLNFCKINETKPLQSGGVPFRQLASFGQLTKGNVEMLKQAVEETGNSLSEHDINERLPRAFAWTEKYAPEEYRIILRTEPNKTYFNNLGNLQQDMVRQLISKLEANWTVEKLTDLIYDIPKQTGLSEEQTKSAQRDFFKNLYNLLIDKEKGPRLPSFFIAVGKEKIKELLTF
jgi:lysyl-tRNA synthetase class 1